MIRKLLIAMAVLPTIALADDYQIADLVIGHPTAKPTIKTAMAGVGYFTVTNNGDRDDVLMDVRADFARVMMHDTKVVDDVATMPHLAEVPIAAGEVITFATGGMHVMFMGLNGDPFEVGEKIDAVLVFAAAGELSIQFSVEDGTQTNDQ